MMSPGPGWLLPLPVCGSYFFPDFFFEALIGFRAF
jgi:hypothetical protein